MTLERDNGSEPKAYHPIFILGVSQRSGTNYLWDLIRQHDGFRSPSSIWEDFLVCHSDLILNFVNKAYERWNWKSGTPDIVFKDRLSSCIGDGLIKFLSVDANSERFVTKTPDVTNIENFFSLFPHAYLLVLVRDGRAVAESRVNSFNESYDVAIRKWAAAAKRILEFQSKMRSAAGKYLVVRYEDLWADFEPELRRIFAFCDMDPDSYDYRSAENQPVRGSSAFRGEGETELHWDPIPKPDDFNPTDRWKHWGRARHELFNCVAGEELERFGYRQQTYSSNLALWYFLARLMAAKSIVNCQVQTAMKAFKRLARRRLGEDKVMKIKQSLTSRNRR